MRFIDGNDGRVYSLPDLWRDWQAFRKEDPDNHAASFKIEMLEILMATINGRNDLVKRNISASRLNERHARHGQATILRNSRLSVPDNGRGRARPRKIVFCSFVAVQ